jgi:hypothetical protein
MEVTAMPIHDWTRVPAGIYHDFHHSWIEEVKKALNARLPRDYYALAEQTTAGFGPDVLTLQAISPADDSLGGGLVPSGGPLIATRPTTKIVAMSDKEYYRRKKSAVAVRHISDDRVVAFAEIISPGNKAGRSQFRALLDKACDLLEYKVHLLLIDPFPPTKRDPYGVHAAIWAEIVEGSEFRPPPDKPLTLVSYESTRTVTAFVEPVAVGDVLPDMPLFLEPGVHVSVPLESTYQAAFAAFPRRWQAVLEPRAG